MTNTPRNILKQNATVGQLNLTAFDWVPGMPGGYMRDLRVQWALPPLTADGVRGVSRRMRREIVVLEMLRCATVAFMKIRTITQRELRNDSGAVLREVEAGRTIIVSRNGTPFGELRPMRRRRFVPRATIADASAHAARSDAVQFRADLDAVVDPHPHD